MTVKMSMYFYLGRRGKTESFYTNLDVKEAVTQGRLLAAKRMMLATPRARCFSVGARDLAIPRSSWDDSDLPGFAGTAVSTGGDVANVAFEVTYVAGTHIARPWLHMAPDDWAASNNVADSAVATAVALGNINAYLAFLVAQNAWMLRFQSPGAGGGPFPVSSVVVVANVITAQVPGHAWVANDQVKIKGIRGVGNQYNGTYRVIGGTAPTLTLTTTRRIDPAISYTGGSTATISRTNKGDYSFAAISSARYNQTGTKKMGRIPKQQPGRRSARR